jgi:hypothetical protein
MSKHFYWAKDNTSKSTCASFVHGHISLLTLYPRPHLSWLPCSPDFFILKHTPPLYFFVLEGKSHKVASPIFLVWFWGACQVQHGSLVRGSLGESIRSMCTGPMVHLVWGCKTSTEGWSTPTQGLSHLSLPHSFIGWIISPQKDMLEF